METTRFLRFNADNHSDPLTTYNEDRQHDTVISHGGYKFLRGGEVTTAGRGYVHAPTEKRRSRLELLTLITRRHEGKQKIQVYLRLTC